MRGLAALSVFFGHMYLIFNESILSKLLFEYGPLRFAVAGSEAVTLFFVLSGFVLSLPFYTTRKFNYGSYVLKRIFRIYIPYFIAIMFAYILREFFYSGKIEGLSNWFNVNWSTRINTVSFIDHLLLVDTFNSNLNNVVWSLVHEMRISIVFPFIMFMIIHFDFKRNVGLGIILSSLSVFFSIIFHAGFLGTELYVTIHYLAIFVIGALIAKYREIIISHFNKISIKGKFTLFVLGIVLYLYAHPSFILNIIVPGFNPFIRMVIDTWVTATGAGILIVFAISSGKFAQMLRNKMIHYIGKISYSLYLIHLPVLFTFIHMLNGKIPMLLILFGTIVATFIVASIMHHVVERPAIKLGKYLTGTKKKQVKQNEFPDLVNITE